jgi:hypothetical protein
LARRAFTNPEKDGVLALSEIGAGSFEQIASRDPAFALELLRLKPELHGLLSARSQQDMCISEKEKRDGWICLTDLVLNVESRGTIRNELSLLEFASAFLAFIEVGHKRDDNHARSSLVKIRWGVSKNQRAE